MYRMFYTLIVFLLLSSSIGYSQAERTITDNDLGTSTYNWSKDTTYILDGFVYLEDGGILNIEAGTVIKAKVIPEMGTGATGALIITRGAQIFAEGTATEPIIFTSSVDDLNITDDLTATDNQTWGGLIILGNAPIGEDIPDGETFATDVIEGIPSTETRIIYGGDDPEDNSGVLRYVSIRHGGSILGADNEINGLTMGGVGSETIVDYVEVFANKDDGIEIFGGTVNVKHAVAAFCGDDALDFDESWDGYVQFALTLTGNQVDGLGEHAVEYDGSESTDLQPQTTGRIYNGTFIGAGQTSGNSASRGLRIRNDADGQFWNCVWTEMTDYVFQVDANARGLTLANNIVWNYGGNLDQASAGVTGFTEEDPSLGGISWLPDGGLDPRPNGGSPALSGAALPSEAGITRTAFRGGFDNDNNWALGWTAMDSYGYFGDLATPKQSDLVVIKDTDIEGCNTLTLTADKEYLLDGYVYVEDCATIIIEAGTVVRGKSVPTTGDQASALIIAKGGTIIADGRADAPIIFTSEIDDLGVTDDLTATDNQTWGGLIVLGNAPIGEDIPDGETFATDVIEGIPSTETRIQYGGDDPEDNSGILRYISIRHGGSILGADNEINGLTMGGVGSETIVDYVEVFANKDDGIEIFGGTVNVKHAVAAFCGDDALDFDESWDGYVQFALTLTGNQVDGLGEHAVEYDGSESTDLQPQTTGRIYNGTFIGAGQTSGNSASRGLRIRNDADGQFWNCVWTEMTDYVFQSRCKCPRPDPGQ